MRPARVLISVRFSIACLLVVGLWCAPAYAQPMCVDLNGTAHVGYDATSGQVMPKAANCACAFNPATNCNCGDTTCTTQTGYRCYPPITTTAQYSLTPPGCNPKSGPCAVRATVPVQWPGNSLSIVTSGAGGHTNWFDSSSNEVGTCGFVGGEIFGDQGNAWIEVSNFSCGSPSATQNAGVYTLQAVQCSAPCQTPATPATADLTVPALVALFCAPPPDFCTEAGGASGGGGAPGGPGGASGDRLKSSGSKGNGPDSGAAGTTGGGSCHLCDQTPSSAKDGSGYGVGVGGGGGTGAFGLSGADLRYGAGGVGGPGLPGSLGTVGVVNPWNTYLGRFWSHDYAERIVMAPSQSHVWLLTRFGSFREFGSLASGTGLVAYQTVTPSDEYRTLYYDTVNQNWQLKGLDGSIEYFLPMTAGSPPGVLAGFLDRVTDRLFDPANPTAHPALQATYNSCNQLGRVTLPDGRSENFAYTTSNATCGLLTSLTEVGTDSTTTRKWSFQWDGSGNLTAIGRPDYCLNQTVGTSWNLTYGDPNRDPGHFGYLTQVLFQDCLGNGRVDAAFAYDTFGNVTEAWRGDPSFTGQNATDAIQLSFDSPVLPTVTTLQRLIKRVVVNNVNQDTWQTATYRLDRDPGRAGAAASRKARVKSISGECPSCGNVANPTFVYNDAANPFLPTMVTDGNGAATAYTFDTHGRRLTELETVQTSPSLVQRQTSWSYDATFTSLVHSVTGPFSPPGSPPPGTRATTLAYDSKGNLQTRTATGNEVTYPGGVFSLVTAYSSYSPAGLPGLIDPPDSPSTTNDATAYTFTAGASNGFLVATRKDSVTGAAPINASTSFNYDALNRLTDLTDTNGTTTHKQFDALNRLLSLTQGVGSPQPLTTVYNYNALGDLICIQRPAGNAVALAYDAAGRLVSLARQSSCSASPPLEQTLFTLDAVGHRILEVHQRFVNQSPVTDATTSTVYSTTCHRDMVTAGDPNNSNLQSTTQFQYDCDNNLISVWDSKHNQPGNPSTNYLYDPLNRLTQISKPWGGSAGGTSATSYSYDLQDHVAAMTDAEGNQTAYVTSDRDLMTSRSSPVTGTTTYSYNGHGAVTQQTDARHVLMTRQLDAADRVTLLTYSPNGVAPDASLTTTYTYDGPSTPGNYPVGRLSSISKGTGTTTTVVNYTYDLFGRLVLDGSTLSYGYDVNGNRTFIAYPGNVAACFTYDVADRQASLSYSTATGSNVCSGATTPIVMSSSGAPTVYAAGGPLEILHLGNGITETHSFDQRFYPTTITAGSLLSNWTYATDATGNILSIGGSTRSFGYQDFQYFLASANGPWGMRAWNYDKIGNRLSENRGTGITDSYNYARNSSSPQGDTPLLSSITLASGAGTKYLTYDPSGNTILEAAPTSHLDLAVDASGRLSSMAEETQRVSSALVYDGRGFMTSVRNAVSDCGPLLTSATSAPTVCSTTANKRPFSPAQSRPKRESSISPVAQSLSSTALQPRDR